MEMAPSPANVSNYSTFKTHGTINCHCFYSWSFESHENTLKVKNSTGNAGWGFTGWLLLVDRRCLQQTEDGLSTYNSWIISYLIIRIQLSSCFGREFRPTLGILQCLRSVIEECQNPHFGWIKVRCLTLAKRRLYKKWNVMANFQGTCNGDLSVCLCYPILWIHTFTPNLYSFWVWDLQAYIESIVLHRNLKCRRKMG